MKKKIGIWFGGCSTEYKVSLQSAAAVISHLDRERYEPVLIGIEKTGNWYLYEGDESLIAEDRWYSQEHCIPAVVPPDRQLHGLLVFRPWGMERLPLDAALPILHGKNGEDGTVQGVLELAGIPLAGCNTLASAVCMEKDMAHRLAAAAGVKTPASRCFAQDTPAEQIASWAGELGYPLFVKPVRAGSSFGITRVTAPEQLKDAVALAFQHDSLCVMEEAISGMEVGCAVMGSRELTIGEVDEIELSDGFFDYTEKYTLKTSSIHVPARIPSEKAGEIKDTAARIYRVLGCSCFARVDMFLTPEGEIYFNEVNTIPGFTAHSRFPNMMKAAGISFEELLNRLLEMAAL